MNRTFSRAVDACILLLVLIGALWPREASAKPLREVDSGNDAVIQLHDDKGGICEGSARYAEYIPKDPALKVRGCWTLNGAFVLIVFLDGDTARVPAQLFRDVKES